MRDCEVVGSTNSCRPQPHCSLPIDGNQCNQPQWQICTLADWPPMCLPTAVNPHTKLQLSFLASFPPRKLETWRAMDLAILRV